MIRRLINFEEYFSTKNVHQSSEEKRLCLYCNNGLIDDEIHLLTKCAAHTDIRNRLTASIEACLVDYNCLSDVQNIISVRACSNKVVINKLAKFVHDALKQRLRPTSTCL